MFYVITDYAVFSNKNLDALNNELDVLLTKDDFKRINKDDYIVNLTDEDFEFVRDAKKLSKIPINSLYKTKSESRLIFYITLFLSFIVFINVNSVSSKVSNLSNSLDELNKNTTSIEIVSDRLDEMNNVIEGVSIKLNDLHMNNTIKEVE